VSPTKPKSKPAASPKRGPSTSKAAPSKPAKAPSKAPEPEARSKGPAVPSEDQILQDYDKRVGRDFYAFLGLPEGTPAPAIDKKCKALARRWRAAKADGSLSPDGRAKIEAMLTGVQLVWRTLTDKTHRAEYDRRMSQGRAPTVDDLRAKRTPPTSKPKEAPAPAAPEPESDLSRAKGFIHKGQFDKALAILKQARLNDPSSPDVMAALGWTTWNLRGDKGGDAEEFLKLALTFEPRHPEGLEWLARIKVEQNELPAAKKLLQQLIRVADDPKWARTALRNLNRGGGR